MAVTLDDVATALGRGDTVPDVESPEGRQWSMWLQDAALLIKARHPDLTVLDQPTLDYVIREAVVAQARRPDDATAVEIAVDDARSVRRYSTGHGRVHIRDEWWSLLDPNGADSKAFAVDTVPTGSWPAHADTCSLRFGAVYCSCGAVLTGTYPLFSTGVTTL